MNATDMTALLERQIAGSRQQRVSCLIAANPADDSIAQHLVSPLAVLAEADKVVQGIKELGKALPLRLAAPVEHPPLTDNVHGIHEVLVENLYRSLQVVFVVQLPGYESLIHTVAFPSKIPVKGGRLAFRLPAAQPAEYEEAFPPASPSSPLKSLLSCRAIGLKRLGRQEGTHLGLLVTHT